jgi:hypothetical protein
MKVVVLQPMYLPWMGYFGMVHQADKFIFYDDVQFRRDSWHNRNKIRVPDSDGGSKWLKVPVEKDFGQKINEVKIDNSRKWKEEHLRSIREAYGPKSVPYGNKEAPYFDKYNERLENIYDRDWDKLPNLTVSLIKEIADILGVDSEFHLASDIESKGSGTEKLIRVLNEVGADEYISGPGAKDYLDIEQFKQNNIGLYWHEFDHPEYNQVYSDFKSHMSVIDLIFNEGTKAKDIITEAERNSLEKSF